MHYLRLTVLKMIEDVDKEIEKEDKEKDRVWLHVLKGQKMALKDVIELIDGK